MTIGELQCFICKKSFPKKEMDLSCSYGQLIPCIKCGKENDDFFENIFKNPFGVPYETLDASQFELVINDKEEQ